MATRAITEQPSHYDHLEKMSVAELLQHINEEDALVAEAADHPIETMVGPEFVTGSSRMKSGTAQKMVLNMISTSLMIRFGRVKGNRMVKMQLTNAKLIDRGTRMIQESLGIPYEEAEHYLLEAGSVDRVLKGKTTN